MRKIIALALAVLVVIAVWCGGWLWGASEIRHQIQQLAAADGDSQPKLTCGSLAVSGFPFRFDIACETAELVSGDLEVGVAGVRASVLVYNPTAVVFSMKTPLTTANAFTGSESRVDVAMLEGSARVVARDFIKGLSGEGWRIGRISIVADGLRWTDTVSSEFLQASAERVELHLLDLPAAHDAKAGVAGLAGFAKVAGLDAPGYAVAAASGTLEAQLTGLPDDLYVLANDPDPLRNWQARGGTLTLVRLEGSQAEPETRFDVSGDARLTPDGLLDMNLAYTTKGVFERAAGLIPPLQVPLWQGAAQPDGSYKNTIHMTNGELRLLTFTLMSMPPLF